MRTINELSIIAHRGSSVAAPENTLAAFKMALAQNADAIEFDVKLTKDKKVIIHHDQTLDRTTNGTGNVKDKTSELIRSLSASNGFDSYQDERVPFLNEVLEELGGKIFMNIELTNYATPFDGLAELVVKTLKAHQISEGILFSSFAVNNLSIVKSLFPNIPRAFLFEKSTFFNRSVTQLLRPNAIHPALATVNQKLVTEAHKHQQRVHVWTVNDATNMGNLAKIGVDAIFTDDPVLARDYFRR